MCISRCSVRRISNSIATALFIVLFLIGCANRGIGPQGGPKDETPPRVVDEKPKNLSLNQHEKEITIYFDEFIQLDKVADNVVISPPQIRTPEVKAYGKKLYVKFDEDLLDSTTYTIDFGSAICDNNEKNVLYDYNFSFSTGDNFDSLQIAGVVLNSQDLNPISGLIVGIHSLLDDTALTTRPFDRIAKTNQEGEFRISNVKAGSYRLWALQDISKDYMYQVGEGLAFCDSILTPDFTRMMVADTLWRDTLTIDTIISREQTVFYPDDLLLFFFKENKQRKYYQRTIREKAHKFDIIFGAPQDSMPTVKPIDFDWMQYAICQPNTTLDTISYWLTDSLAIGVDTLRFEMTYQRTDSLFELEWKTDTISAIYRAPRLSEKAKQQLAKNYKQPKVKIQTNGKTPFDIFNPLQLILETPAKTIEWSSVNLYQKIDTILKPIPLTWDESFSGMHYEASYDWEPEASYELHVDSAAILDIYGNVNDSLKASFKIKREDEYATLIIRVEPFNGNEVIQILDEKDNVVRQVEATAEGAKFEYLKPQSYFMRLFVDENNDGEWTTGDFVAHRQPEQVYYFPQKLTLRANWDFEEVFRYLELPINDQKPDEIRKDATANQKK